MDKITKALTMAIEGHIDQVDKSGAPYLAHLVRVSYLCAPTFRPVALLHDYFEDVVHEYEPGVIAEYVPFLDKAEVVALAALTRKPGEKYFDYLARLMDDSYIALHVKEADIRDHLSHPDYISTSLKDRYEKALKIITGGACGALTQPH